MMDVLLSAYLKETQELLFRVYADEIPEADRKVRSKLSHLTAWDLLGAAMLRDFGIRHVKAARTGLEKPQLTDTPLCMNLSHCADLAVCAVSRIPVGLDAEIMRKMRENLLPRICTPEESAYILAQNDKNRAFTRIWTLKEAYGKWSGEGIRIPLETVGFRLEPHLQMTAQREENLRFIQMIRDDLHIVTVCVQAAREICIEKNNDWEIVNDGI